MRPLSQMESLPYHGSVGLPAAPLGQSCVANSPSKVPTQDTLKNSCGQAVKRKETITNNLLQLLCTVTAQPTWS